MDRRINSNEALRALISSGMVSEDQIKKILADQKREEVLSIHKHSIWEYKGKFYTHVRDDRGKLVIRKRKSRQELLDFLIQHYEYAANAVYIEQVFNEWVDQKLENGEIQRQTYDRYKDTFKKYFSGTPLCKMPISCITEDMLEDFIWQTIKESKMCRKAYSSIITIINGIFKRARKQGHTDIAILQFVQELEIPRTVFQKKERRIEEETFSEDEIPAIKSYIKEHKDIWNLGILLQFYTGVRIGELSALKWEDVGEKYIYVHRTETKYKSDTTGKWTLTVNSRTKTEAGNREIVLVPQAKEILDDIKKINPNGEYVFENRGKRIRGNTFNKRLDVICSTLGLSHHSSHKIRKTYGTALLDAQVNDSVVAEQMGHRDISTTRRLYYFCNKNRESKIRQVTDALNY